MDCFVAALRRNRQKAISADLAMTAAIGAKYANVTTMPNREDFRTMPGHLIRRAHQISVAIFMEECAAHNVTSVQYACLSEIARQPGVDATRLASAVAFDRSTLGNVLERLEAKGWVDRRPSAEDRRVKLLHISEVGRQLLDAIEPAVLATQKRLLKPLSPGDRKLFMRLISEMVEGNNEVSRAPMGRVETD